MSVTEQDPETAIVAAWQNGALSRDSMLDLFRRGEILPDGRTNEEEERLVGTAGGRRGGGSGTAGSRGSCWGLGTGVATAATPPRDARFSATLKAAG